MKKMYILVVIATISGCGCCQGQAVSVPFTSERWNKEGAELALENYMGKECILLKKGGVFIKDLQLQDGIIEVDMSFPQERGFPGVIFRTQDLNNGEHFYVRPHQSGNPDATQYTPVFNGSAGWQLYHGEGYSKAIPFKFDQWHHIKIDVHGRQAEVYIDDMQQPFLKVTELKRDPKAGTIALSEGGIPTRFANLQYTVKQPITQAAQAVPANGAGGLITKWQVSNQASHKLFEKKMQLTPDIKSKFTWTTQPSEPSGTLNLAKFTRPKDTGNVMVAKLVIDSEIEQVKAISFGFSDYVAVFLNDKVLYFGIDNFRSRDYRFLGTIGFFDMLALPLKKGRNELWFVLAEDFGGWGVKAKLENMERISLP
jgi:hypothetical protein